MLNSISNIDSKSGSEMAWTQRGDHANGNPRFSMHARRYMPIGSGFVRHSVTWLADARIDNLISVWFLFAGRSSSLNFDASRVALIFPFSSASMCTQTLACSTAYYETSCTKAKCTQQSLCLPGHRHIEQIIKFISNFRKSFVCFIFAKVVHMKIY